MEIIDNRTSAGVADTPDAIELIQAGRVYSDPLPIKNYLLVKQNAKETVYRGTSFVIPDTAQQNPNKGVVVAIGPRVPKLGDEQTGLEFPEVKPGDVVTFGKFNAESIEVDGEEFQLVMFDDVKLVERVTYALRG